jgi:hypothetical protein
MHEIEFILLPKYNRSDFVYGYSTNQNATLSQISNWQDSPFFNLEEGTYLFYAKKKTGKKHFKKLWTVNCGNINCTIQFIGSTVVDDCSIVTLKPYTKPTVNVCSITTLKPYTPTVTVVCTITSLKPYTKPSVAVPQQLVGVIGLNV